MTDHAEIVKRLRESKPFNHALLEDATDAIETLLAERAVLVAEVKAWRLWYTACQPSPQYGLDVGAARAATDAAMPGGVK